MKRIIRLLIIAVFCVFLPRVIAKERANIIVAQDGSGQFKTIQDAINSVPANNKNNVVILIRNGVYREKLFIEKSFITLVGEDRDSTRIVYAELRRNINTSPLDMRLDWGTAVVNIDSFATDITLANLTVHNNYGSLHHTDEHQFAIRGGGTRIIILNCTIIADGGDTLSLWNKKDGMYYHANCYFEGGVDFVCPRGWCYITGSKFFGRNLSASIWHDGDADKNQKFVIRSSWFDGIEGFPLGRNHRDGQMYLLDCQFSHAMADTPIYWPAGSKTVWQWGDRHYYYNCHRQGGDYSWFKDNLETAAGAPKQNDITAKWTFDGRWDPEETMPAVLPVVSIPRPGNGAQLVQNKNSILKWVPSRNAVSHKVYFGRKNALKSQGNQKDNSFNPGRLKPKSIYYWRIDEVIGTCVVRGPLWQFTTE
jgi:pectinesterase